MNTDIPRLSIVICTKGRPYLLRYCLDSLIAQSAPAASFEVVVVQNPASEAVTDLLTEYSQRLDALNGIVESRPGLSWARNAGWRAARGSIIAFLDDDAIAAPTWAERIIAAFASVSPTPSAVGGPIEPWYESTPPMWFRDAFETRSWGNAAGFLVGERAQTGFSGSNMAIQRKHLERLHGFSTDFGMVGQSLRLGEDAEFFSRLWTPASAFWYDPNIVIRHFTPSSHFRIAYRLRRSFKAGIATAHRRARIPGRVSCQILCPLFAIAKGIISLPLRLYLARSMPRTEAVMIGQTIASEMGHLVGVALSLASRRSREDREL